MNIITLDFETFFSDDYKLKKMTTEAYVRDPRFEAHGCAVRYPNGKIEWRTSFDTEELLLWQDCAILCHHSQFDGLILNHHYNLRPKYWLDTLSMARQQLGNHLSASLDNVRQHFGMPLKRTPYNKFKGKHWHELDPQTQREVADGACDEVESIWQIFNLLAKDFPAECYPWVDNTVRMFTEPKLIGDIDMLGKLWQDETQHKARLLAELGVTAKDLGSDDVFAGLLRKLGVEPERKDTGKQVKYAFAKTDPQMQEMADDEDDDIRALVEARLSVKSTLQQTRSERLGYMASRGAMCVYLSAFGAHTNRDSGGDKVNWQNFTRSTNIRAGAVDLRKTIKPPKGYLTAKVDKAQIECRVLNMFAGQWDVIDKFRNKEDPYVGIATQFYGFQVTKAHEKERGTGKQLELSCFGPDTLVLTARGPQPITAVQLTDKLWDGATWVEHSGVVLRGERYVINVAGLQVTPDHLLLSVNGWVEAAACLRDVNTLYQVLERGSGSLLSPDTSWQRAAGCVSSWFSAHAARQSILLWQQICVQNAPHGVTPAPRKPVGFGLKNTTAMRIFVRTMDIAADCLIGLLLRRRDAYLAGIGIMAGVVSSSNSKAAVMRLRTLSRFLGGIIPNSISTVLKTIRGINAEIYALPRAARIAATGALCESSNRKLHVYDIAFAGPRNRYTVVSDAGLIIAHNCGYGAGTDTIIHTARKGTYGPPVYLTNEQGERAKTLYRSTHTAVTDLWREAGRMISAIGGTTHPIEWGCVEVRTGEIVGPNGTKLRYPDLRYEDDSTFLRPDFGTWKYTTRKGRTKLYGAKLIENLIQWLAWIAFQQDICRIGKESGQWPSIREHDAGTWVIPDDQYAEQTVAYLKAEMSRPPAWMPDIPLDADAVLSERT